jgi:hypothetical protein
MHTLLF